MPVIFMQNYAYLFIHHGFLKLERFLEYVYIIEHVRICGTGQEGKELQ